MTLLQNPRMSQICYVSILLGSLFKLYILGLGLQVIITWHIY